MKRSGNAVLGVIEPSLISYVMMVVLVMTISGVLVGI
jgi:hypothetical protein